MKTLLNLQTHGFFQNAREGVKKIEQEQLPRQGGMGGKNLNS